MDSTGLKVYGEGEWKVRQQGVDIGVFRQLLFADCMRVEVAVRAFFQAPGDVDIQAERWQFGKLSHLISLTRLRAA